MNELYEKTIEVEGRVYRYDPDYDCYYRSHHREPESERERWAKVIGGTIFLILFCIATRYILHGKL